MKKKIVSLLLASIMVIGLLPGCGNTAGTETEAAPLESVQEETQQQTDGEEASAEESTAANADESVLKDGQKDVLRVVFPGSSASAASFDAVEAAINEIVADTIDCDVQLDILQWGVIGEQSNLILSSGEDVALLFKYTNIPAAVSSGQLTDLTDLLPVYAPEAMESMGRFVDACYINGKLYGLPTFHEYAARSGLICSTDILNELGVDPAQITDWDDVENVLAMVKEAHPDMNPLVPADSSGMLGHIFNDGVFDQLQEDMVGVYIDGRDGLTVHNIYDTDEFREVAQMAYDWNQKGYFIADPNALSDTRQSFLRAGTAFGFIGSVHPGVQSGETNSTGIDITAIPITEAGLGTSGVSYAQYVVPNGCMHPEKAVALMNIIYTNPDVQNLLLYGIEGTDYVVNEDGTAGYPEGVDSSNVGWSNESWLTGNASIALAWETDPDMWTNYREFNENAVVSPSYGFVFDAENVRNEITAVSNVLSQYSSVILSGLSNPEESVPAFLADLETAGMQRIVDEAQAQLDAWAAEQ